jgi:LPS export ABC transporter protein LptC
VKPERRLLAVGRLRNRTRAWLVLVLAASAFALLAFFIGPGDIRPPTVSETLAEQPNAYLEDGVIEQYRADGSLQYRLVSRRVAYFDDRRLTKLSEPVFDLHPAAAPPWHLEAGSGEVRTVPRPEGGSEEEAQLDGGVVLSQTRRGARIALTAPSMVVYPERDIARGARGVMIEREIGGRATAAGFEADLASGRIELHSNAEERVSIIVPTAQTR